MIKQLIYNLDIRLLDVFNGSDSLLVDQLMLILTSTVAWIPLYLSLLVLVIRNHDTMKQIMLVLGFVGLCLLLSSVVCDALMKPLVGRLRPCNDPLLKYQVDVVRNYRPSSFSFFSGHTSNTLSVAIFFSLLVRNKFFTITMLSWSLVNSYTRLYLGVHYFSDIFIGWIWGTISGLLTYYLYRKAAQNTLYSSDSFTNRTSTGYSIKDIDMVIMVVILSLIVAIIKSVVDS